MGLRVVQLCGANGVAPWFSEIVRELKARGHDVTAIVSANDSIIELLGSMGVRHHVLHHDLLTRTGPLRAVRKVWKLAALLRAERPDVLHSHLFSSNISGRIAGWLADVPVRLSMNAGPYHLESRVLGDLDLLTAGLDTRVIASCEYVRGLYVERGMPRDHIELIYYGSSATRFDPETADPARVRRELNVDARTPLVGMIAAFYPPKPAGPRVPRRLAGRSIKGHDVLLRAVPLVLDRLPETRFVLAGDGPSPRGRAHRADMQALAASLGIEHAVIFAGHRSDVPDVLSSLDVAVQCSRTENLGGTAEALLMRVPLIVSRVGGMVETVHHEETGLVVPVDDPPALARAIIRLLEDRELAGRLAGAGRSLMLARFTSARTGSDIDALYARLAGHPRFKGRPPHESGYRRHRMLARLARSPRLVFRLMSRLRGGRHGSR